MTHVLIEARLGEMVKFLSEPDGLKKQAEGVTAIKKSKALRSLGIAIVLILLGALASVYGIADVLGGKKLPMGVLFLIGGPIGVLGGLYMVFSSLARAATASQISFETDLEKLCRGFYSSVLCKKTTDFGSKDDQIVEVCQFIPLPILENYRRSGWDSFIAKAKPRSGAQAVQCARCHKQAEHSQAYYTSIPVPTKYREELKQQEPPETQDLIRNLYLKCQDCGTIVCYECVAYSSPSELRYLCPVCGKATNGWNGLAERWMNLRRSMAEQDVDFTLTSVHLDQSPRSDPRIVDETVHLYGTPFGSLSLSNVALNIEGRWFLASPEPIVSQRRLTTGNRERETHEDSEVATEVQPQSQVPVVAGRLACSLGIETLGDVFTTLIESGTSIPCERREMFSTAADNQPAIDVHVLQGSSSRASANVSLGRFRLTGFPRAPRGVPQMEVIFRIQQNGDLLLVPRDLATGADVHVLRV